MKSSRVILTLSLLLGAPLALAQEGGAPPPAQQQTPTAAFDAIQAKIPEFRAAQSEQARDAVLREIYAMTGAFIDAHAAAAEPDQLGQVASYWFELAGMFEATEEQQRARITQLRAVTNLHPQLAQALDAMEAKLNIKPGIEAPAWTATDVHDGSQVTLQSLRGKLVLMDFWATWCPPCKSLMAQRLAPLHARWGADERFVLVGVGLGWNDDTAEKQREFGDANHYAWKKVFDAEGASAAAYGVDGIPFLCLVDAEGKIVIVGSGWDVIDEVEAALRERLGPGVEPPATPQTPAPPHAPGGGH